MEWIYNHWDTVNGENQIQNLLGDIDGDKQIMWELMDYGFYKNKNTNDDDSDSN